MSYNAYDKDTDTIIDLSSDIMVDAVPTEGSTRPVSSGGVYDSVNPDQETVAGNPLSFTTDSKQVASKTIVTLEPIQAGSGDPSPSNVREISGYDDIRLYSSEDNLLGGIQFAKMIHRYAGGTIDTTNKTITFKGSSAMHEKILIKLDPQKSYTCIITAYAESGNSLNIQYADVNGNRLGGITPHDTLTNSKQTTKRVINNPGCINLTYASTNNTVIYYDECGIFEGDIEISDFEPYISTTDITIPAPDGTIYGGTLDVESGELTVTHKAVNMESLDWVWDSSRGTFNTNTIDKKSSGSSIDRMAICEIYKPSTDTSLPTDLTIYSSLTGSYVFVKDTNYNSNLSAFITAITGKKIAYMLQSPKTYHLSPHQVKLLQGANVVTTNGTSLQLTYHEKGEMAGLADLTGLANSVEGMSKRQIVKIGTISGNTGTYGNINLNVKYDKIAILDAYVTNAANMLVLPFQPTQGGNNIHFHVVKYTDFTIIANTDVNIIYHYVDISS